MTGVNIDKNVRSFIRKYHNCANPFDFIQGFVIGAADYIHTFNREVTLAVENNKLVIK